MNEYIEKNVNGEKLRLSELRYRRLFETAKDGILILHPESGCIIDANPFILQLLDMPVYNVIGKSLFEIDLFNQSHAELLLLQLKKNHYFRYDHMQYTSLGGIIRDIEVVSNLYVIENEEVIQINIRDISIRKKAEDELRKSEERFRILVDGVKDYAIYMIDKFGYIVSWNAGAERIKGYNASEIMGRHFSCFYPQGEIEKGTPQKELELALLVGRHEEEGWRVRKDGTRFWANLTLTALMDSKGELQGFAKITKDITEQKQKEMEIRMLNETLEKRVAERTADLEQMNKKLLALNATKDKFFSIIAHDLRNPFSSLLGFTELFCENYFDAEQSRHYSTIIHASARTIYQLLENLLAWANSQTGIIKFNAEKVDLNMLIDENIKLVMEQAQKKNIEISKAIAEPCLVSCDVNMTNNILRNLIINALKFTKPGGSVNIDARFDASFVEVCIHDTGIGIAPENLLKIFRIDSAYHTSGTLKEAGSGLGLLLCKEFVEKQGGTIWAESEPGIGSDFTFTLPLYLP